MIDEAANGDVERFLELFNKYIRDPIVDTPFAVRKAYWDCY
jgi:hypothetical protein